MANNHRRGPGGRMMPGEKPKNFGGTLKQLLHYMGRYKIGLLFVAIFAIGSTVFNIRGPKVMGQAVTEIYTGLVAKVQGTGGIDFDKILSILTLMLGLYGLAALLQFLQSWLMTGISQKICYRMRREISEKIQRLPMAYFEKRTVGEILSRITNDVDTLGQSMGQSITQLITSVATIIGVLYMMLTISPLMTLIALVILPVSALLVMLIVKFSQKYFSAQQRLLGEVNGQVEEVFSGQSVVRAFNQEETVHGSFSAVNQQLYTSAWKSQFFSGLMMPIMTFVGNLGYVAVALSGAMLAVNGTISVGDITAFISYVKNFTQPITQLAQVSQYAPVHGRSR